MLLAIVSLSIYIVLHIAVEVWQYFKGETSASILAHMAISLLPLITFWALVTSVEVDKIEVQNPWVLLVEASVRLTVTIIVLGSLTILSLSRAQSKKDKTKKDML